MKDFLRFISFVCLFVFFAAMISCKKEGLPPQTWGTDAVIVGWNYGYCPVCGGFYLNFGNNTRMNDSATYYIFHWDTAVNDFFNKYGHKTPRFVQIDWQEDTFHFSPQKIDILKMGLR